MNMQYPIKYGIFLDVIDLVSNTLHKVLDSIHKMENDISQKVPFKDDTYNSVWIASTPNFCFT